MTTNETIARWLGAIDATPDLVRNHWRNGMLFIGGRGPWIAVRGIDRIDRMVQWEPDTDITLWHGEDGLLAEIERRGKWLHFIKTLAEVCGDAGIEASLGNALVTPLSPEDVWGAIWMMLRATPAQLAAALVKTIGEK